MAYQSAPEPLNRMHVLLYLIFADMNLLDVQLPFSSFFYIFFVANMIADVL